MVSGRPDPCFTWADLEGWAERGLIQPEQLTTIRAHVTGGAVPQATQGSPAERAIERPVAEPERPVGMNLVTIAYHFGAFMILLAYTFFMGLQWEDLGRVGQAIVSGGTIAGLWWIGGVLRTHGHRLGGDLLVFAGTGIVPLAAYSVLRAVGLWPDSDAAAAYRSFYQTIDGAWVILEVVSIVVTLAVLWRTRFPLLTLLAAFWGWYLSMDLTELLTGHDDFAWGPPEWAVGAAVGLALLGIGIWQQRRRGDQEWSLWLYIFGHVALLCNLAALAFDDGVGFGLLFLGTYLAFVVASVWLQARVFLVFGALGCYAYVARLAFDVFDGSLGFVFGLAAVGLLIVLSTVGYQRYAQPWLARRLASPSEADPVAA